MAVEEALVGAGRSRERDDGAASGIGDDPLDAILLNYERLKMKSFHSGGIGERRRER